MVVGYLLLFLLPLAAIAYIVWDQRRKAADREAASTERLQQMLGAVRRVPIPGDAETSAESATRDTSETKPPSIAYVRRQRILDAPQTLLYYLLRTALPDYVVLAQVPLSLALEVNAGLSPYAREEALRILAPRTLDFLVCDRSMRPIAAVQLIVAANAVAAAADSLQSFLAAVGVRCIELDGTALPRKDAIREIVLGEDAPAARTETELEAPAT